MCSSDEITPSCSEEKRNRCIKTFSASQIGAFVVMVLFLYHLITKNEYTQVVSLSWLTNAAVVLSLIYFVAGSLIIEENHIARLQAFPGKLRTFEFSIRLAAMIVLFGLMSTSAISKMKTSEGFPIGIAWILVILGILYLVWDAVYFYGCGEHSSLVTADIAVTVASLLWILVGNFLIGTGELAGYLLALATLLFGSPLVALFRNERSNMLDFFQRYRRSRLR